MQPLFHNPDRGTSILRHKPFALFWCARVATTLGFQMLGVAVGWQIYALTGSPLFLGLVGLAQFLPMFLLTLVVGQIVDRYDRRSIARICQTVEGVAAGALAVGSLAGWQSKESILILMLVVGAARAFEYPSMHALVPGLVPVHLLPRAVAGYASANQAASTVGPALGGLLYMAGPTTVYATAAILFLAAGLFLSRIRIVRLPPNRQPVTLESLFAGISFIRRRPAILGAISLDLFAVLLGGATALLPIYARDILITGPWGLALLRAAPAAGALGMSVYLAHHPLRRRVG
ncbi:MAG: MFS transporter, partial [Chloroflexi bacterium]